MGQFKSATAVVGAAPAHRPDIDGLRAIAVLSVLFFHANAHWLPGGFVGVDIFFVISGFLISGIILGGLKKGSFSYLDFYARRIKRIFPALCLVLTFVCVVGWLALFSDEFRMLGKHVAAGAGFLSNIVLWREAGYFDAAGELKPLLHLWSLGIEEQFYLIWPLLLTVVWKRGWNLLAVIAVITILSFALNAYWIADHEIRVFYLPVTRFWELSLGALLGYAQVFGRDQRSPAITRLCAYANGQVGITVRNLQSFAGIALLLASLAFINRDLLFPGWWALLPTLGAALLIAAGNEAWINRRLLGNGFMVWFGLISYPLYLWHWPLLSFQRILGDGTLTLPAIVATVALSVLLAWLTYRFIETPIRTNRWSFQTPLPLAAVAACLGIVGFLGFQALLAPRSSQFGVDKLVAASSHMAFPGPDLRRLSNDETPVWEQGDSERTVLFIGDSEVEQYYPRIDWILTHESYEASRVIFSSRGGCPPLPHVKENHLPACNGLVERDRRLGLDPNVDTIVIAADWAGYFLLLSAPDKFSYYYDDGSTRGEFRGAMGSPVSEKVFQGFAAMVKEFTQAGKTVYIILPSPTGDAIAPRHLIDRSLTDWSFRLRPAALPAPPFVSELRPVVTRLKQIATDTGAKIIDPIQSLCNARTCPLTDGAGLPIYKDDAHLDPVFVKANVHYLDDIVTRKSRIKFGMRPPPDRG